MPGTCHGTLSNCTTPAPSSPGKDCRRFWLPWTSPALSRAPAQVTWLNSRQWGQERTWIPGETEQRHEHSHWNKAKQSIQGAKSCIPSNSCLQPHGL